ncbi:MAG: YciI family protein [Solirubrobacteraceae bacterium]
MKYALLIYEASGAYDGLSDEQRSQVSGDYIAITTDDRVVGGAQLQPIESATTVRVQDGRTLTTDGPFAETKEVFGGYYLLEADDLDAALEVAARIPAARMGGSVEIRAVVEPSR